MEGSSSDPNHKSKGICASKDRVVTTSLHGILSVWNACHRDRAIVLSVELTLGDGVLRLYFSHIFIYTAMSIISRKDCRKQLPWALLSRT